MKDLNILTHRILPTQMDVKQNAGKALTDILRQFETGSTIKAVISELTSEGNAIFTTKAGRFMMPSSLNLNKGDRIELLISSVNSKLQAVLTSTNKVLQELQTFDLVFMDGDKNQSLKKSAFETPVIKGGLPITKILQTIEAEVKYVNFSNINHKSALYQSVGNIKINDNIQFKVIASSNIQSPLPPGQILAEMAGNDGPNKQLLKTSFGIFSINKTHFPEGKQIVLEAKSINSALLQNNNISTRVEDILFKMNQNWPLVQALVKFTKATRVQNILEKTRAPESNSESNEVVESDLKSNRGYSELLSKAPVEQQADNFKVSRGLSAEAILGLLHENESEIKPGDIPKTQQAAINEDLDQIIDENKNSLARLENNKIELPRKIDREGRGSSPIGQDVGKDRIDRSIDDNSLNLKKLLLNPDNSKFIKELSKEINEIKDLVTLAPSQKDNGFLLAFPIPIFNGEEVQESYVSIYEAGERTVKFTIELDLSELGLTQFEGVIKFSPNNFADNFDLSVRSSGIIDSVLRNRITEIFAANQNITGIHGEIYFERSE